MKIVIESLFLIVMSSSCGLNSYLAVNIHDKSTSILGDYSTKKHIQGTKF